MKEHFVFLLLADKKTTYHVNLASQFALYSITMILLFKSELYGDVN